MNKTTASNIVMLTVSGSAIRPASAIVPENIRTASTRSRLSDPADPARALAHQGLVTIDVVVIPTETELDAQMLAWLRYHGVPHTVVATKLDKVKSSKRAGRRRDLAAGCQLDPEDVVWVSATKGDGVGQLRSLVRNWLV